MKTSEVLYRAADLIEERGWGQGIDTWSKADGAVCVEGALMAVASIPRAEGCQGPSRKAIETCPAYVAVVDYLAYSHPDFGLWFWNDSEDRSSAEVIEVLRAAAVIEAAKETADEPVAVSA